MPARGKLRWVRLLVLLSTALLVWVLFLRHGQFIRSDEAVISPLDVCLRGPDGLLLCTHNETTTTNNNNDLDDSSRAELTIPEIIVILSLYTPLVMLPFALMTLQFAVCWEPDGGLLGMSVAKLATSSLLLLLGITMFTALHWAYVSLAAMTAEFYICLSVCVNLAIAAGMTWMRRLDVTEGKGECV